MMVMYNRIGFQYFIYDVGPNECHIRHQEKSISVKHNSHDIINSWCNWQEKGLNIQEAFPYLTADEREFLMTGLTPEEFERICGVTDISDGPLPDKGDENDES
jgi:hypothetical protein